MFSRFQRCAKRWLTRSRFASRPGRIRSSLKATESPRCHRSSCSDRMDACCVSFRDSLKKGGFAEWSKPPNSINKPPSPQAPRKQCPKGLAPNSTQALRAIENELGNCKTKRVGKDANVSTHSLIYFLVTAYGLAAVAPSSKRSKIPSLSVRNSPAT